MPLVRRLPVRTTGLACRPSERRSRRHGLWRAPGLALGLHVTPWPGAPQEEMYIFMEYCDEGTLEEVSRLGLQEHVIRLYSKQITVAINVLHEHGIVHRDIKGNPQSPCCRGPESPGVPHVVVRPGRSPLPRSTPPAGSTCFTCSSTRAGLGKPRSSRGSACEQRVGSVSLW